MPRAGLSPDAVVGAALRVVDEHGPDALTLAAVAAECGVATPSLYKHVASLGDLRSRLAVRIVDDVTAAATTAVLGRSGDAALEALMIAYHHYALEFPARYALVPQRPDADPAADPAAGAAVGAAAARFVAVCFAVLQGYDLDDDRLVHATRILRSAMHGFAQLRLSDGFQLGQDLEATHAVLVRTMQGLRTATVG